MFDKVSNLPLELSVMMHTMEERHVLNYQYLFYLTSYVSSKSRHILKYLME